MIWTNRDAKICTVIILSVVAIAALFALVVGGCTATPEPTGEPTPTPTMETSPVSPVATPTPEVKAPVIDEWPDEGERFQPMFHAAGRAMVNWAICLEIPSTTHLHQLELVRQLRRVDNGQVLLQATAVTGIFAGADEQPTPHKEFAAGWEYDLDLQEMFGVDEAEEWVKPVWRCVLEPGEEGPCLCCFEEDGPLEDCTVLTGRCEGWAEYPEQAADGFCFTNFYSELPQLFKTWLPIVFVERE